MKKILLISVIPGNMQSLIDYYNNELINTNFKYNIELMDCYKFYDNQLMGKLYKIKYLFKKYDLVISDYPTELLKLGKKSIFMDHGSGLKLMPGKYEMNDIKIKKFVKKLLETDYFITQANREKDILYSWLPYVDKNKLNYISLGQPRNDKLFNINFLNESKKMIYAKFNIPLKDKLLLLAPTWRGYNVDFSNIFEKKQLKKLNEFLKNNNITLMYRPHYLEDIVGRKILQDLEKFIVVDNKMENDAQKVLAATDYLITDYSGILTEFLALNKPIMFLDCDLDKYKEFRGLAIDYYNNAHTPGPKVKNVNQIILYLKNVINGIDKFELYRKQAIKYYYKYYDGNSSKRIWRLINEIIN